DCDTDAYLNSYQSTQPTTTSNKNNIASDDLPSFEANLVEREDLAAHLEGQLGYLKLNDAERRIAALILGNLDDDGYLKLPEVEGDPLSRLATEADVSLGPAARTLLRGHQPDPKGGGSRPLPQYRA